MAKVTGAQVNINAELAADMAGFFCDPWGFVLYAFPWGSGKLQKKWPEKWQEELLKEVGEMLRAGALAQSDAISYVVREAVASGHGIGKSALCSWLILWGLSTMENTRGVITANTKDQLTKKTWPELKKWHNLCITRDWFELTATAIFAKNEAYSLTWRFDAIPWSKENSEAFAGLHNQGQRIVVIFDEASAIDDLIWEVTEGALTDKDTQIIWIVFGNPTRNTGRFFDCFHKFRHLWKGRHVDARTVNITNKALHAEWIETYGIESDFVKVRVLGQFPSQSDRQFIGVDLVDAARGKHLDRTQYEFAPVILGLDPAWYGEDSIEIVMRQGLMSKVLASYPKNDNDIELAGHLARFQDEYKADAVFIDMGYGTGVYSAGKMMNRDWQLVPFGGKSGRQDCLNKRMEMWYLMREWLQNGGTLPDDQQLCDDLVGPEYQVRLDGKLVLESKDEMKKRGLPSPNKGDALALTFAMPVTKKAAVVNVIKQVANTDFDILG